MKVTLAIASLLPFLAAAGPVDPANVRTINAPADAAPAPGQVKIRAVTYGGTGCPQGTVGAIISQDASTVTLIFDEYAAQTGPKFTPAATRKNCQLNFALTYPGGFQYSVLAADYRGYADIDKGVTGTLKSTYYFSGSAQQTSTEANFVGPMVGDYVKHDEIENSSTVWSPCGTEGMLNINSQVRLQGSDSKASGLLTTDSIDAKFVQKLGGGSSSSPAPAPPANVPAPPQAPPAPEPEDEEDEDTAPSPSGPINIPSVTTTPSRGGSNNSPPSYGNSGSSNSNSGSSKPGKSSSSSTTTSSSRAGSTGGSSSSNSGNSGFGGFGNFGGFGSSGSSGTTTTGQSDSFSLNNPNAVNNPSRPNQPPASWNSGSTTISWSG